MNNLVEIQRSHLTAPKNIKSAATDWTWFSNQVTRGISSNCAWSELIKADEGLAYCERMLQAIEAESMPATPSEIGMALKKLVAGYSSHGAGDLMAQGAIMTEYVIGMKPSCFSLRLGCENAFLESEYFTSVAVVYRAIAAVESDVQELRNTIQRLRRARDSIQKVKDEYDRGREEARRTELRHQCFAAIKEGGDLSGFEPELVEGCRKWLARQAQEAV